jgi:hypothetical protein
LEKLRMLSVFENVVIASLKLVGATLAIGMFVATFLWAPLRIVGVVPATESDPMAAPGCA